MQLQEFSFNTSLLDTFDHIIPELSGDELSSAMQVCKHWNGKILTQKKSIAPHLEKMILFIGNIFEAKQLNSARDAIKTLSLANFTAETSLLKMEDELDLIIQKIAIQTRVLNQNETDSILSNKQFPKELRVSLRFFLEIERNKEISGSPIVTELTKMAEPKFSGYLRRQYNFLKALETETIKKIQSVINSSYEVIIAELAKKRYFNLAINLSTFSFPKEKPLIIIAKHLAKHNQVSRACELIKGLHPIFHAEGVFQIIAYASLKEITTFWPIEQLVILIENSVSIRTHNFRDDVKDIVSFVFELFKNEEYEKALSLIKKADYKIDLPCLVEKLLEANLYEQALAVAASLEKTTHIEDEHSKLLLLIAAYFFKNKEDEKAMNCVMNANPSYKLCDLLMMLIKRHLYEQAIKVLTKTFDRDMDESFKTELYEFLLLIAFQLSENGNQKRSDEVVSMVPEKILMSYQ